MNHLKKSIKAITLILIILLSFSACSGAKQYNKGKSQEKLLALCNEARANDSLTQLKLNDALCENAQKRADEIAQTGELSHTRPDGSGCFTAVTVNYSVVGENLAKGDGNAENIFKEWMNSPAHKENIMNGNFTQIGFGCAENDGTIYWVQLFVG